MKQSKWLILALLALAQFMVVLDLSVVNVALPAIKQGLHFTGASLQWVITAYALTFGGFLLFGGRAADLFGRRRMLLTGMLGFTFFSLLIGLAQTSTELVALRVLQGASAALMSPSALSIVLTTFREGKDRNTALGVWTAVAAGGAATGLLVGGIISQYLNWRWNFFINVPVGALVSVGIMRFVPIHAKEVTHNDLDLPGAVLVTSGLMSLVYAIVQAPSWGWTSGKTIGLAITSLLLLVSFVFNELRSKHPLVPLSIFRIRNVAGANLMMAPVYAGMMGMFFLISIYIQTVLGEDPVKTGLSFLPIPILIAFTSTRMPRLVPKFGYKPFLIIGPILLALGMLWLSRLSIHSSYLTGILPGILFIPVGMAMTFVSLNIAATSGVPANESGLASGLITTSQQMGGALGLAILSGIAASVTSSAHNLSPLAATVHGDDRAFLSAVLFMLFALGLAIVVIKQHPITPRPKMTTSTQEI